MYSLPSTVVLHSALLKCICHTHPQVKFSTDHEPCHLSSLTPTYIQGKAAGDAPTPREEVDNGIQNHVRGPTTDIPNNPLHLVPSSAVIRCRSGAAFPPLPRSEPDHVRCRRTNDRPTDRPVAVESVCMPACTTLGIQPVHLPTHSSTPLRSGPLPASLPASMSASSQPPRIGARSQSVSQSVSQSADRPARQAGRQCYTAPLCPTAVHTLISVPGCRAFLELSGLGVR